MSSEEVRVGGKYYNVIQGTFRTRVNQEHPDAVRRDWETPDGRTGTKYERIVHALFGKIEDIRFFTGEFGTTVNIYLDENEEGDTPVVTLSTATREGEDFLKKLPNIDLDKEVRLRPFMFDGDNGDEVRGMEVTQRDEVGKFTVKVGNFFRDTVAKTNINGYPNPDKPTDLMDKEDWKVYFIQARKFLVKYAEENVLPNLKKEVAVTVSREQINPGDIPF